MKHFVWVVALALVACAESSSNVDGGEDAGDDAGDSADAGVTRDPYPHACTYERDRDADGAHDWVSTYELDGDGRVLREEMDSDGDGDLNFVNVMTYDDEGREILRELDEDADGEPELSYETEYRSDGQIARTVDFHHETEIASVDYVYDDDGFLIERVGNLPDGHTHGGAGSRTTYENDENGCPVVTTQDDYDDGMIELIMMSEVDEQCRPLEIASDQFGDGEVDWVWSATYDDDGQVLTEKQVEGDTTTFFRETEWDGDLMLRQVETRGTSTDVTEYFYDEAGNLERVMDDPFGDGAAIDMTLYENDARGNALRVLMDDHGDGVVDDIATYSFDCWE